MIRRNKHSLLFVFRAFFLGYIQTIEVKGQSSHLSYGASIMKGDSYCGHQEDSAFAMHSVMKFPQALYEAEVVEQGLMRIQADEFLRNMPPDLQHQQTLAILKAIDGDNTELMAVRNSRNAPPKYSDNVETKMISQTMRIYEPKGRQDSCLPVLLYLHGGGWTFGSINSCGRFCDAMAASGEMRVIALD